MSQKKKLGKVKGKVIASTDKAVLIQLTTGKETWFPFSKIYSNCDYNNKEIFQEFLIETWILIQNNIPLDFLVDSLVQNIKTYHDDNLISIYGIGSYFNDDLPATWKKNDVDLVLILNLIEEIPKEEWNRRFKSKNVEGYDVYIGYNTIEMYQDKEAFSKYSGVNFKWALLDVKYEENSSLLYGEDIRDKLPDPNNIKFEYDDILARSLYHIEKSLKEKNEKIAKSEFSKAIFKFSYYLCIFFDENFHYTSIIKITNKLKSVVQVVKNIQQIIDFLKEAVNIRAKGTLIGDFTQVREKFIKFIFSRLLQGGLHKRFSIPKLTTYLVKFFSGFPLLKRFLKTLHTNL